MKRKIILSVIAVACLASASNAQTNTFPATGNVGIGTLAPVTLLDVVSNGSPSITIRNTGGPTTSIPGLSIDRFRQSQRTNLAFRTNGVEDWTIGCLSSGTGSFYINGVGGTALYVDSATENIGIGTTTPLARLSIKGQGTSAIHIGQVFTGGTYNYVGLNMNGIIDNNHYNIISGTDDPDLYFNRPSGHKILFVKNGTDYQMALDSAGRLGIGTIAPFAKLDVSGDITANIQMALPYQITVIPSCISGSATNTGTAGAIGGYFSATGSGGTNNGIQGISTSVSGKTGNGVYASANGDGANNGGSFDAVSTLGTSTGVSANAHGSKNNYGVWSTATSVTGLTADGIYASVNGTGLNYGIYANASGGTKNWAGYFNNGNVYVKNNLLVGTTTSATGYKMSVAGKIICTEMKVQLQANWPDYVFEKDHQLISLEDLEKQINQEKHLPGIPSSCEVEENDGIMVGDMQTKLLEKVEELTLYVIQQQKEINNLKSENKQLQNAVNTLQK